jgi:PAS domain S-box-containing protein
MTPILLLIARLYRDAPERWAAISSQELMGFTVVTIICASIGLAGRYRRRIRAVTEHHAQRLRDQARALSHAPIVFREVSGKISEWNDGAARLFGWTQAEAAGRLLHELLETQFPTSRDAIEAALTTTGQWQGEVICRHKDGSNLHIATQWILYRDEEEVPIGVAEVLSDVTLLRKAEARILESDRRKDEFLSILAHELRNPLAPIRSGLDLLELVKDEPEQIDATCEMMKRQMKQLVTLIDDLLDVSRITRGTFELKTRPVDLFDVIQSAVEAATPAMDAAGHTLTVSLPQSPVRLNADPHRLAQVLCNLLDNAAKYTPPGGTISLTAAVRSDELMLSVQDNGVGISPDRKAQVFELFARIQREPGAGPSGLGIGLALVKSIVEMHGGHVHIVSAGEGRGAQFQVYLPLQADSAAAPQNPTPVQCDAASERRRVLVVDDNRDAARLLGIVVEKLGNDVRLAFDGIEAVEAASEFCPDIVFLDLGMPRLDGYGAARELRRMAHGHEMLLVALTGWGQDGDRLRSKEAGFDHHLVKPADPEQLKRILADGYLAMQASKDALVDPTA